MQIKELIRRWVAGAIPATFWRGSLYADGGISGGAFAPALAATVLLDARRGNVANIVQTGAGAFTIGFPSGLQAGQIFTVELENASGGALGAITTPAGYHMSAAFPTPANGTSQAVTFFAATTALLREISRTAGNVT